MDSGTASRQSNTNSVRGCKVRSLVSLNRPVGRQPSVLSARRTDDLGAALNMRLCPLSNALPQGLWLDLDPEVKDPLGDSVCRITSSPK
jgi:hypothetical protein